MKGHIQNSRGRGTIILSSLVIGTSLLAASFYLTNQCDTIFMDNSNDVDVISATLDHKDDESSKIDVQSDSQKNAETDFQADIRTDILADPDPNAPWPRVAWLMSFPNSGTSYTMMMTQRLSNRTAASNYGHECMLDDQEKTVPIHDEYPNGPYLLQPSKRQVPDRYIITKTHCAGYGTGHGPGKSIHTSRTFLLGCTRGSSTNGKKEQTVYYDEKIVQRAIHLIRDPFNNIVSRFHLQQHAHTKKDDKTWLKNYPSTPEGLQKWCAYLNDKVRKEESTSRFMDNDLLNAFKGVPCHSEFFEYAQWHRLAHDATRDLKVPTLVLHYEDYGRDLNGTVDRLFNFLELQPVARTSEFITGKNYDEYFSQRQRAKVMELIKKVVDPETWELLERYDSQ